MVRAKAAVLLGEKEALYFLRNFRVQIIAELRLVERLSYCWASVSHRVLWAEMNEDLEVISKVYHKGRAWLNILSLVIAKYDRLAVLDRHNEMVTWDS